MNQRRRGNERDGQEDRERWRPLTSYGSGTSAYHTIVGDLPEVKERDFATCSDIVMRVQKAIDYGGWTRSEWRRLHRLKAKWKLRADGGDARFNVVGTKKTGLSAEQRKRLQLIKDLRFYPQMSTTQYNKEEGEANSGIREE